MAAKTGIEVAMPDRDEGYLITGWPLAIGLVLCVSPLVAAFVVVTIKGGIWGALAFLAVLGMGLFLLVATTKVVSQ